MNFECKSSKDEMKDKNKILIYRVFVNAGEVKKGKETFEMKKEFKIFSNLTKALEYENELRRRGFKNRTLETVEVDRRTFQL